MRQSFYKNLSLWFLMALASLPILPLLPTHFAHADSHDGVSLLSDFLARTPQAAITFRQTSLDEEGQTLSQSDGRFWYKRPDLFRMEYEPPQQLLMISDGKTTWTYEADLNQVLKNPAQSISDQSVLLAVLSSGSLSALHGQYNVSSDIDGEQRWAVAEARDPQQTVRKLRLAFSADDGELQQAELTDAFGGIALLHILSVGRDNVDDDLFRFLPPTGVEVIGNE